MPDAPDSERPDRLRRRFVEATRRAEIVSVVNAAATERELGQAFLDEVCEAFEAEIGFLIDGGGENGVPRLLAAIGAPPAATQSLAGDPACARAMRDPAATVLEGRDLLGVGARSAILAPFHSQSGRSALVGMARTYPAPFDPSERAFVEAVAASVGHALERIWAFEERDSRAVQQTALVRAAKLLNRSLDGEEVLTTLCEEVAAALGAEKVAAALGDERDGYTVVAGTGLPESFVGYRHRAGHGLGALAARSGSARLSHAYGAEGYAPRETNALRDVEHALAVPLRWQERVRGFLEVGFTRKRWIAASDVELAEGFADLAGLACGNAERHAALRAAADHDSLTGCLNHGAFQRHLRREIERADRAAAPLCLALIDLDGFKAVNDRFGHLAGDSVLREVGQLLRGVLRGEDLVARYGGDEFAVIMPGASEESAIAAIERVRGAVRLASVPGGAGISASVGLAEWLPGDSPRTLVERADKTMRATKRERGRHRGDAAPAIARSGARSELRQQREAVGGRIGLKVARHTDSRSAAREAAGEVARAAGADECTVLRLCDDGSLRPIGSFPARTGETRWQLDEGAVGRCLREKRPVAEKPGDDGAAELAAPIVVDDEVWGAIACRGRDGAFTWDHAALLEAVADHLGAALRAIDLNDRLRDALIGTSESLAAALEAKDAYTAEHARSIADLAVMVGRRLGLDATELDDLRYGAIFHDIGKIAVPDEVLNKPGPLTDDEFALVKRHPLVGDEILAPVPALAGARRIVRHDHEHWDGSGYPAGLRGPEIPLGARIVLVVDAYHAMVSERPYRAALRHEEACREIARKAGTQFDPAVARAFLEVASSLRDETPRLAAEAGFDEDLLQP